MFFNMFKIMNKDSMFSTGGSKIRFSGKGKTWTDQRGLIDHLLCSSNWKVYLGCTLVRITNDNIINEPIENFLLKILEESLNKDREYIKENSDSIYTEILKKVITKKESIILSIKENI